MNKIYWAAPLHGEYERTCNDACAKMLRDRGFQVYVPHEHGVWEAMVNEEMKKHPGLLRATAEQAVRHHLFVADKEAVEKCDVVIALGTHSDGSPSEGMIWEMGYAAGLGKPVYLINPAVGAKTHWDYNLMPEFGSVVFTDLTACIEYMEFEEFK